MIIRDHQKGNLEPGNPYNQDYFNVGFNLGNMLVNDELRKYEIMSNGLSSDSFSIVNKETGERKVIDVCCR